MSVSRLTWHAGTGTPGPAGRRPAAYPWSISTPAPAQQPAFDAWSRLLATFRAVYGGVQHEAMRLPPYGGSLFDPDRFPFLEGRKPGTGWRDTPAEPIKVSNQHGAAPAERAPNGAAISARVA